MNEEMLNKLYELSTATDRDALYAMIVGDNDGNELVPFYATFDLISGTYRLLNPDVTVQEVACASARLLGYDYAGAGEDEREIIMSNGDKAIMICRDGDFWEHNVNA